MATKDTALDTTFPGHAETEGFLVPTVPGASYIATGDIDALDVDFDGALDSAAEYRDEWPIVEKIKLVGQPFVILKIDAFEGMSDDGIAYNIKCVLAPDSPLIAELGDRHFSFNDGSTGVYKQLGGILAKLDVPRPLLVKGGLRVSRYWYDDKEQAIVDGPGPHRMQQTTFYLCSSPEQALKSLEK